MSDENDHLPSFPPIHIPVAIVIDVAEMLAIKDAILVYEMAAQGEMAEVENFLDRSDDGGYVNSNLLALAQIAQKLDKANSPLMRQITQWIRDMDQARADLDAGLDD